MNEMNKDQSDQEANDYWAAGPTRECGDEVMKRCHDYWNFCQAKGWFSLWRRMYFAYNPNRYNIAQTVQSGEHGEYRTIKVNHFKNLLEHIQTLTITDRPAWQAQATNSDSKSQKQCIIAEGLLDYMMREKRVERYLREATRNALLFSEGFVMERWDTGAGEAIAHDDETNETRHAGDIFYNSLQPVDVVRDPNLQSFSERSWVVVRTYENKYDLAAKYPEYAEEIRLTNTGISATNHYLGGITMDRSNNTDQIQVLTFFHVKSASVPDGRQMVLLEDGTVLSDSILLYHHIPLHRITPADQIGTPFGQSVALDLASIQEMIDSHYTTILSINENLGIPKILIPIGSQITADSVSSGFQAIQYDAQNGGTPSVLQMPQVPATIFQALELLSHEMETLSGVNSVSRGNPEASLKSGSALALVQSMAIQFNAPLQQSYIGLLEDVGTATIQILQDYASEPRVIQIAGKHNKGIIQQSFTSKDIDSISRVQVQAGNPLSKTISGRLSIAQDLLQNKIITNAAEYLQVLQTGLLEPMIQGPTSELLNLASENEYLTDGEAVPVLYTDNHQLHIQEHSALASDPQVRMDAARFDVISKHILEHINYLSDPAYQNYRQLMGYTSVAPAGMPSSGPDAGNNPALQPTMGQVSPGPVGNTQVQQMAANINMPKPPQNPLTGQRAPLPGQ